MLAAAVKSEGRETVDAFAKHRWVNTQLGSQVRGRHFEAVAQFFEDVREEEATLPSEEGVWFRSTIAATSQFIYSLVVASPWEEIKPAEATG